MRTAQFLFLVLPAVVQVAAAGVLWVEAGTDYPDRARIERTVKVDTSRVSVEIRDAESHQTIVYQSSPEQVWMIDHTEEFYREFDRATLKILRGQVEAVGKTAAKRGKSEADSELRFEKVWSGEAVGVWTCDRYEGRALGVKTWDVCAGDWGQFEVRPGDLKPLSEAVTALRSLRLWPEGSLMLPGPPGAKDQKAFAGFPVQRIRQQDDRPVEFLELREFEKRDFEDTDFLPPSKYTKRSVLLVPAQSAEEHEAR